MKEKIIIFLIGLLLGAIISTGSIYIYTLIETENKINEIPNDNKVHGGFMGENKAPDIPNNNN